MTLILLTWRWLPCTVSAIETEYRQHSTVGLLVCQCVSLSPCGCYRQKLTVSRLQQECRESEARLRQYLHRQAAGDDPTGIGRRLQVKFVDRE